MPTNDERAQCANAALGTYLRNKGEYDSPKPLDAFIEEHEISDLICDLLHLSDKLGFNTSRLFDRAMLHYEPERAAAHSAGVDRL